jgi:hypothetical protein
MTRHEEMISDLMSKYKITSHPELIDKPSTQPEDIALTINPGDVKYSWAEFRTFVEQNINKEANEQPEKADLFEGFARRKLILHHCDKIEFAGGDFFRKRYLPLEMRVVSDYFMEIDVDLDAQPTEAEITQYYEDNKEEFRRPSRIEAWHLARKIRYPLDASPRDRMNAENEVIGQLWEVRRRIAEQGQSFLTWANRFTEYDDGGYLGWRVMMSMPPEWVSVVATLDEGEISEPFRVSDTYELVLRGGLEEGGIMKFEKVRDRVVERARAKKISEVRAAYMENLLTQTQASYSVQPLSDLLARLFDRWKRPPEYWLDPFNG